MIDYRGYERNLSDCNWKAFSGVNEMRTRDRSIPVQLS